MNIDDRSRSDPREDEESRENEDIEGFWFKISNPWIY